MQELAAPSKGWRQLIITATIVVILIWLCVLGAYLWRFYRLPIGGPIEWAHFGDYVGGLLNPVVGTMTLVTVVVTVLLQRELLLSARGQIAVSKDQLQSERFSARTQSLVAQQEAFENTFFKLLETVAQRAKEVTFRIGRIKEGEDPTIESVVGQEAIGKYIGNIRATISWPLERGDIVVANPKDYMLSGFRTYYEEHEPNIGPYLRTLGNLYNYIYTSRPSIEQAVQLNAALARDAVARGEGEARPFIHHATFYSRVVTGSISRLEIKLFAFYVASTVEGDTHLRAASEFDVFRSLRGSDWWGREALPE